ncbi:sulfatase-like hydrolase/transferase [Haloferula sp.]|uniref:sulfatase-like hydrolase/transferase n=1 Tax=Haloferula sp. TaxID=2497595 RepID=UPI003C719E35
MKSPQPSSSVSTLFAIALAWCLLIIPSQAKNPPNIVFFLTDDQSTNTLGCYGNEVIKTPNIDRLAEQGTRFDNAFVSQPICWVSRTTILTGLTGRSYGTEGNPELARPDAVETLYSDILREEGYRTGFFGKWHAKMPKGWKREDHFDEFEAIGRDPFFKKQPDGSLRHETEVIVDRGIDFIMNQPKGKPFALNLWFNACHAEDSDRRPGIGHFPWPKAVDGMYDDITIDPPRLNDPAIFEALPECFQTSITRERYFWRWNTPEKYQTNIRAYYRMVSGIDGAIGRFLKALNEAGLTDNTIIVYSADNGYLMGNRGLAGKWSHFEESTRVPLIITDPRVPKNQRGQVSDAPVLNLDFPATFLDWAGIKPPERYQGRSLQPIVNGKKPDDWRTETFHEHFAVRNRIPAFEGIRSERFKYGRYFDHDEEFLHDLQRDPDELVNLAKDPEYSKVLKDLRARTAAVVDELGGPLQPLKGGFNPSTVPNPESTAMVSHKADKDGFVRIFNGKNLNGWTGDPEYWSVKNGAITGTADGSLKRNHFLAWTGSTIRNFDLRAKVKITAGGNSGIQYRSTQRPEFGLDVLSGYQCDVVANTPKYNGMLYEERGRRILSHAGEKVIIDPDGQPWVIDQMPVLDPAPGKWHDFRILVRGNHHQHWIDGKPTADLIDLDEKGRSLDGVLAVQVHVGPAMEVQFKDFRIKHLPDDLPLISPSESPIPATAYGVRPQAKLPKDWKPPIYGEQ